jgi:DNA-binding CsgD family transcriptional regulator
MTKKKTPVRKAVKYKKDLEKVQAVPPLTRAETQIISLMTNEYMISSEIAKKLNRSVRTIENHRHRAMHKLKAKNSVMLTKMAINMKITTAKL